MQEQSYQVDIEDGLIVVRKGEARDLFASEESIRHIIELIENEVSGHIPDLTTTKGRKAIASLAMKVSKSKVILDGLGKDLVTGWKDQSRKVDQARKIARDTLDELRDQVRQPLTDYEAEQERLAVVEQARIKKEQDHADALIEDEAISLRRENAKQQAAIERLEQLDRDRKNAARLEVEQIEREKKIRKDEKAKSDKAAAEEIQKVKDEADQKIKDEATRVENQRLAKERLREREDAEALSRSENKRRRGQIKRTVMSGLVKTLSRNLSGDLEEAKVLAQDIIAAIEIGEIDYVSIDY